MPLFGKVKVLTDQHEDFFGWFMLISQNIFISLVVNQQSHKSKVVNVTSVYVFVNI